MPRYQLALTEEFRRRYDFRGDDDLSMREAMKLMDELQQMEELERQFRRVQTPDDLEKIDPVDVAKLLGDESAQDLERLKELAKKLEEAGHLRRQGDPLPPWGRGHPPPRRKAAPRHLRPPQARSLRPPRGRAPGRRRRSDRRGQALRVRRSVPARSQGNPDERGRAQRRRHAPAAHA